MLRSLFLSVCAVLSAPTLLAQAPAAEATPCPDFTVEQMSLMIVPYTKEGESIRNVLDLHPDLRIAIAKVDEFFQGRGFQTVNFISKLKEAEESKLFATANVSDYKQILLRFAQSEIGVDVDMTWNPSPGGNSASLALTAYLASTSTSMASATGSSNLNRSENKMEHAQGAVENLAQTFLDQMQANFTKMKVDGRPLTVNFTFSQGSSFNMDSRIDSKEGKPLWAVLKAWLAEHAYKHRLGQMAGKTTTFAEFPMVRTPLVDPSSCMAYATEDFALEIQMFLESIGIQNTQDMKPGKIMVTIN